MLTLLDISLTLLPIIITLFGEKENYKMHATFF